MTGETNEASPSPAVVPWPERHPRVFGFAILLILHGLFLAGPLRGLTSLKPDAEPLLIGIVQLVYVIPLCLLLMAVGYLRTLRVVMIVALVTFLLNAAACVSIVVLLSQARWG